MNEMTNAMAPPRNRFTSECRSYLLFLNNLGRSRKFTGFQNIGKILLLLQP